MIDTSTDPQVGYRPAGSLDTSTALDPYAGPFSRRLAAHLMRRFGFGGSPAQIDALAALDPRTAVDRTIHPTVPELAFADFPETDALYDKVGKARYAAIAWWLDRMLRTQRPYDEKLALFWHGHFATSMLKAPAPLMVAQIDLFRRYGSGDFRPLLAAVVRDPAMLIWLDNRSNTKAHPNENFAREVMELFTLGLGQYTEDDVHAAARAFTGWGLAPEKVATFRPQLHDDGEKTLLGHTGNLGADGAIAAMVASPAHPRFLARKLLEFYVYSDPEPALVDALAQRYVTSGYNVGKTVGTIARSNVFFSPRAYRALPKSPVDFVIGSLRFAGIDTVPKDTQRWLKLMGQTPLEPPSVKGWDGGPTWINTATLLARFNYTNGLIRTARTGAGAPTYTPDAVTHEAGGFDASRVLAVLSRDALQDDVPSAARASLIAFLDARGAAAPDPLGIENYQDRVRAALALVLNLPANQLG